MPDTSFPARSTPFPSRLLDDIMPLLSDTEWRILCVVVRQTLGWADGGGGRKAADWLTQSQLKARTGRASEALSRAVDGLVKKGLIQVCSEAGELLATPQERRRCPGRILFRLAPQAQNAPPQGVPADTLGAVAETSRSLSEPGSSQSEHGNSVPELRNPNTTKETQDKILPSGGRHEEWKDGDKPVENSAAGRTAQQADTAPDNGPSDVEVVGDVRRFLLAYQEGFAQRSARGETPPIAWGRDGRLVKGLLAQYGYARLLQLLERFFQSEDAWVQKRGYALSCFPTLLPTLLMEPERAHQAQRRARTTPVVVRGPSARHWQQTGDAASSASLFERYPHLRDRVRSQPP